MSTTEQQQHGSSEETPIRGRVPNQIEEALNQRLRRYAQKQCTDVMQEFADCSKDKLFSVVYKCAEHQNNLIKCIKLYANEDNMEKMRQAYLRGELMKKRTYNDYQEELSKRLAKEQENNDSSQQKQ